MILIFQSTLAKEKDSTSIFYKYYFKSHLTMVDDDCDACGCSASGGSMGFSSMLNSNFVGTRYFNQEYRTTDGLYSNSSWYQENFKTVQLWARIPVFKKFQVSAQIPYHNHNRDTNKGVESLQGIGDINLMGIYQLYQTHRDSAVFVHTLNLGAGLKLPTGKYEQYNSGLVNPSFQLGTGSWDYTIMAEYVIKRKHLGLNNMMNYIFKTENNNYYRFGNQFNYSSTLFYLFETDGELAIAPQLGIAGEVYDSNYQYRELLRFTKGNVFFGKIGFELGKNRFSLGANTMFPLVQNLADGRVEAQIRWSLNVNFSL